MTKEQFDAMIAPLEVLLERHIGDFDRAAASWGMSLCGLSANYKKGDMATRREARKHPKRFCSECVRVFMENGSRCTPKKEL